MITLDSIVAALQDELKNTGDRPLGNGCSLVLQTNGQVMTIRVGWESAKAQPDGPACQQPTYYAVERGKEYLRVWFAGPDWLDVQARLLQLGKVTFRRSSVVTRDGLVQLIEAAVDRVDAHPVTFYQL